MKQKLTMNLMTRVFTKLAGFNKQIIAAAIMLGAAYAANAATYTVSKTDDTNDTVCDVDCSLREAITAANANADNDTIVFAPAANGTITLLSALPALINNGSLSITGNGATDTIISGNNNSRVFLVQSAVVTMSGMTLRDGNTSGVGGGISQGGGSLTLIDCVVSHNISTANGAAISGNSATVNLNRVSIANNFGPNVAGIYLQDGNLNVSDSTFTGNSGGIADVIRINSVNGGTSTLTMTNSTISGNTATQHTPGIILQTDSPIATNKTVANLINCTITNNSSTGLHGAIWLVQSPAGTRELNLRNTIVSGNLTGGVPFDIDGTADPSSAFNLVGTGGGLTNGVNSNIVGVNDPQLFPLADNGGPTLTHEPLASSLAIDGALNSNGLVSDQRGAGFSRTGDNIGAVNAGDGTDIGAFEVQIVDSTPPVITPTVVGTMGNNGWYTSDVEVTWTVTDPESAVTLHWACAPQTVANDTSGVLFTCQATSVGGTSQQSAFVKRDGTAPIITFASRTPANANGWNKTDVAVQWNCVDWRSGATTPTVSNLVSTEGANQSITGACYDNAGHSAADTQSGIKIDKTAPTLAPTVTPNPVLAGGTATAAANATDTLSGIASQSCEAVNTATAGSRSLTCTATDLAGNTKTADVSYQVNSGFNFTGFFQPVDNLPSLNIVVGGQAIPLKFSLGGYQGLNIFTPGYPVSTPIACDANEPGSTIEETVNAGGSSLSYDPTTDQYSYVWKTNKAWKGTCRIFMLKLSDGSDHYAKFRFK